jgi:hypothetical protein
MGGSAGYGDLQLGVKVKDVTEEKEKLTWWMMKQKTDELSDGDSFTL